MFWKILSLLLIIVLICYSVITPFYRKVFGDNNFDASYCVIFRHNSILNHMNDRIVEAYRCISPIYQGWSYALPVTQNLSHWQTAVKTDKDKYIIVSSSPSHYIEVFEADYNDKNHIFMENFRGNKMLSWGVNKYTLDDMKNKYVHVKDLIIKMNNYYNTIKKYSITNNNCHKMTRFALKNVFGIDCDKDIKTNYNAYNLYKEFMRNKSYLMYYNSDLNN